MAAKHTLHVALTQPLVAFVEQQVASGRFATASEVVRAGLRLLIERGEDSRAGGGMQPASGPSKERRA